MSLIIPQGVCMRNIKKLCRLRGQAQRAKLHYVPCYNYSQQAGSAQASGEDDTWSSSTPVAAGQGAMRSWMPQDAHLLHKMARQSLLHELTQKQQDRYEAVVDWFLSSMPATYFRQTTDEARLEHLQAISALLEPHVLHAREAAAEGGGAEKLMGNLPSARDVVLHFERVLPDQTEVTFIQPGTRHQQNGLLKLLDTLPPADGTLHQVKVFTSRDGNLAINVFVYKALGASQGANPTDAGELLEYAATLQSGEFIDDHRHPEPSPLFEPDSVRDFVSRCTADYVKSSHPRRFCRQMELLRQVSGTEGVAVDVEDYDGMEYGVIDEARGVRPHWVTLALANVLPKVGLSQTLRLMPLYDLNVLRCHLDVVSDKANGSVTMLRVLVVPNQPKDQEKWADKRSWEAVQKDLKKAKWLDDRVFKWALERHPGVGLERAEVANALVQLTYGVLNKRNPWAFSRSQIYSWLDDPRYFKHATAIADLFMDRFNPEDPLPDEVYFKRAEKVKVAMRRDVELDVAQSLFENMVDAVSSTYRTNFYMPGRYALSMRVDPKLPMTPQEQKEKEIPFGVFFVHGRRFNAFHCRFRDIARGGMRIVTPGTSEQVALEGAKQFDEAYGLAFAQQLKNKDIPEGGSKAVLLVDTTHATGPGKSFAMRKSVKAFTDSILDLIVDTPETKANIVDLLGRQELLYLGPDEQVITSDINWIVARAKQRGYPIPSAFMSSKPDAGINHKDYGVTSEGVFVFLDVALQRMGIDPRKQSFSVKLTGGPDGDVAGNMIKILHREYGNNVRIVGVADGTGCAEDPEGLNHEELLRLFYEAKPIGDFRFNKLSPKGKLFKCDTEEGIRARNTMHMRVKSDAFVTGGGRPNTINKNNYKDFIGADGKPSSPLIVEGANLFVTAEARQLLFEHAGVIIVKDSSANKCGVICSSFEIIASMLMDEQEFKDNKEAIVADVLERLRTIARKEAELLFREHKNYPGSLPKFSERISNAINRVTDATREILNTMPREQYYDLLLPLVREHLPKRLVDLAFDRISTRMPVEYLKNAMASCAASRMVYTEGIHFVDTQPLERLGTLAFDYIRTEGQVRKLLEGVEKDLSLPEEQRAQVMNILKQGGTRAKLGVY